MPQTPLAELTALPRPLARFKGAFSRQGGEAIGKGRGEGWGVTGRGREGRDDGRGVGGTGEDMGWDGEGREREERATAPPKLQLLAPPLDPT